MADIPGLVGGWLTFQDVQGYPMKFGTQCVVEQAFSTCAVKQLMNKYILQDRLLLIIGI